MYLMFEDYFIASICDDLTNPISFLVKCLLKNDIHKKKLINYICIQLVFSPSNPVPSSQIKK